MFHRKKAIILSGEWNDELLPDLHYASLLSACWLAAPSSLCGTSLPIHPATPCSSCRGDSPILPLPPLCSIQHGCYGNCSLTPGLFVTVTRGLTWILLQHPARRLSHARVTCTCTSGVCLFAVMSSSDRCEFIFLKSCIRTFSPSISIALKHFNIHSVCFPSSAWVVWGD